MCCNDSSLCGGFGCKSTCFQEKAENISQDTALIKGEDIISFYVRIRHRPLSYIAKLLGYPALLQIRGKKGRAALMNSCKYVRKRLSEIGDYYLRFNSLYNAYKHGFRIGVFESGVPDEKPYTVILWPPEREKLAQAIVMRLGLDVKPEYEMCQFMTSLLGSVTQTFIQRVLKKEVSFTARAFGPE